MWPSVHPDRALLFVGADRLMDRDQLVGHWIALLPDPRGERSAMDVVDDVHLALVLHQRKAPGPIRQAPLPSLFVDRQAEELDQRRAGGALRAVLGVGVAVPDAREIHLRRRGRGREQPVQQEYRYVRSPAHVRHVTGRYSMCHSAFGTVVAKDG